MKPMEVIVERISLEHARGFWDALDSVARERRFLAFVEGPQFERTEAFVKDNVVKNHSQFVALVNGVVVGWCDIIPKSLEGFRHAGHLGMGVKREYRGQGIGKKLLCTTIGDAFAKGLAVVELEVFSSNASAIALYESVGFVHEGRKRKARFLDGIWDDNLVMGLLKEDVKWH